MSTNRALQRVFAILESAGTPNSPILPTLLYLLDAPIARDLPGHVLDRALDPALVASRGPRLVESYGPSAAPAGPEASEVDPNVLERLRSLGYIN